MEEVKRSAGRLTSRRHFRISSVAVALILLLGCGRSTPDPCADDDPAIGRIEVGPVAIERLERPFLQLRSPAEIRAFADRHPLFARQFLLRPQYPSDDAFTTQLTKLLSDSGFQTLGREATRTFGNLQPEQEQLRGAFQHIKHYFPGFRPPHVATFVSGLSQDIFVNDSLLVLGLDFFIGPKATYRPAVYRYIQHRYAPPYLIPSAVLPMSSKFLKQDFTDKTLLNEMVQYGKSYYFLEKVLPCVPDTLRIGYSARELAGAVRNEQRIWSHFLNGQLLYATQPFLQQKYVGERPNVPEIGKQCPGRIGQWVGWQIVRAYMTQHPDVTLAQLMAEKSAQKILDGSRYKPRKPN